MYRREVLKGIGIAGSGGLVASQSGLLESVAGDEGTSPETRVSDYAMTNWVDERPDDLQFNMYNTTNEPEFSYRLAFEPTAKWDYETQDYRLWAITDWGMVDDSTFELSIDTDITWSNGDNLTSQDIATQLKLERLLGSRLWDFVDSIERPDDATVRLNMPGGGNPALIKCILEGTYLHTKHSEFEQYLDAVGDDRDDTLRDEIRELEITDPVTNGPFGDPETDEEHLTLKRSTQYHKADNITFLEYQMQYIESNQEVYEHLQNGRLDAVWALFTPPNIVDDIPDTIKEAQLPAYWGFGIVPNHRNEHLRNKNFRKALMHVIDREQVATNAGPRTKKPAEIPTCASPFTIEEWIDSRGDYETYGMDATNTDKATELLEAAGYVQNDGAWMRDGSPVELPVLVPSGWSDWITAAQSVTDQLSAFGFESSVDTQGGTFWERIGAGDFTLVAWNWLTGGVRGSHPYFNAAHQYDIDNFGLAYGLDMPADIEQKLQRLSTTADEAEEQSIAQDLIQRANDELPVLPMTEKVDQSFVNGKRLNVPEEGSDKYDVKWPSAWLVRTGDIGTHPDLPSVVDDRPTDPDGDRVYEDINGNGRLDSGDVISFFENREAPAIADHTASFDFNDNGRIDFDDIVSLFKRL